VVAPADLQTWLQQFDAGGTRDTAFICAERLATGHLKDIFLPVACHQKDRPGTADTTIYLIVGPEGGFTGAEIANAEKRGVKPVSLGRRILRSETAAIYSLAQVIWCLEKNS
jgi:16S rRNA (uracil1498-N3)-methyltransferase